MRNTKASPRALALILAALLLAGMLSACSATNPNYTVLKVGELDVGVSQYYTIYSRYKSYYSLYGLYDVSTAEKLRTFQDTIFDILINNLLPANQALKEGITLTAEEEAQIKVSLEEQINTILEDYASQVDASITDEAAIREAEMALFKKDISSSGWTYAKYTAMLEEQIRNDALAIKYMEGLYAEISISDENAQSYYEQTLAEQQTAYAEDPAQYYTDYTSYLSNGGTKPLAAPEGYHFYKHILIKFAAEGETKDVDAIVAEIKDKLAAGADFDELVAAYGEDPGMQSEPYINEGYLISEAVIDKYYDGFAEAALALKNIGDVSEPVETTAGYHFIQYTSDVDTTPVPYEDVKDAIFEELTTKAQSDIFSTKLVEWKAENKIVKHYDLVANIK